ncbi:MAG: hypothetical protein ABRQ38_16000 [Candidatus Eremiobacterota bacterium]
MKLTNENLIKCLKETPPEELVRICRECQKIATYDKIKDDRLKSDPMPVTVFPVPYIVTKDIIKNVTGKLDFFIQALIKLEQHILCDRGGLLYNRLMNSLTPGGRHLVEECNFESDYSLKKRHRRIDGYLDFFTGDFSIIEVNQAAPLAIDFYDVSQRMASHFLNSLGFFYQPVLLAHHILNWFVDEYTYRYAGKFPHNIALVIEHGYLPKFIDLPRMALICEELAREKYGEKLSIKVCFPYEISLSGEKIMFDNHEIDMIWRNSVYMTKYREEGLNIKDYETICHNPDKYLIINATRVWLTRTKEVFSLLSNEECRKEIGLSEEEDRIIKEIVPYSVNLKYETQVAETVIKEKDLWITKPADAGFGKGVEFGAAHSEKSWISIIKERTEQDGFIFQKRVTYPTIRVTDIDDDGHLINHCVEYDFCPHHINGAFTGTALTRTNVLEEKGKVKKMNLVGGGIILPVIGAEACPPLQKYYV